MFGRSRMPKPPDQPVTAQSLRQWLVDAVAQRLSLPAAEVDTGRTFEDHGLDSRAGLELSGQIEKVLERRLSPALLYQHPTIDALVAFLARDLPDPCGA